MKVNLTITLNSNEYDSLQSIPDLENYVISVIKEEIEAPNYSHRVEWDLDTYVRKIITEWEEDLKERKESK